MDMEQFCHLLDIHGARFDRWPAEWREAGRQARDASPAARERWAAASRLDTLFAADAAMPRDAIRNRMVIAGALRRIRAGSERRMGWRWLFSRPTSAAFAATVLLGWFVGVELGHPPRDIAAAPQTSAVAIFLGDSSPRFEDLFQ